MEEKVNLIQNELRNILLSIVNNKRSVSILFILSLILCIGLRIKHEIAFPNLTSDYSMQAVETENFIEGHGFTDRLVNLKNISEVIYYQSHHEAIGLSIILVPLYYLTGSLIQSLVLVQIIGIVLLIFSVMRIFKIFKLNKLTLSAFLLFTAFSLFYDYSFTTDNLSAALFLWAIALTMEICMEEKVNRWKEIMIGFFLFLAATLRYAYIPNIIVIPAFFFVFSFIKGEGKAFFTGLKILVYAAVPAFILFSVYKLPSQLSFMSYLTHLIGLVP